MFNVVADLVSWIPGVLGVPAYSSPPAERPARFATVQRTGGGFEVGWDTPSVAVQLWAESEHEASELAVKAARALVFEYPARSHVRFAEVDSVYSFADPQSQHARWQVLAGFTTQH